MASRNKTQFVCNECGGASPKWVGQCPHCNQWNTLVEAPVERAASRHHGLVKAQALVTLDTIEPETVARMPTGSDEFDRVLGGGLVSGSVILIGGDPGIGKSTLLLQALAGLAPATDVLYVSGEESASQIALRARRLGLGEARIPLLTEIDLERIQSEIETRRPVVVVIDSIQTVYSPQLQSAPGSVAQVRECAAQLTRQAKADC